MSVNRNTLEWSRIVLMQTRLFPTPLRPIAVDIPFTQGPAHVHSAGLAMARWMHRPGEQSKWLQDAWPEPLERDIGSTRCVGVV